MTSFSRKHLRRAGVVAGVCIALAAGTLAVHTANAADDATLTTKLDTSGNLVISGKGFQNDAKTDTNVASYVSLEDNLDPHFFITALDTSGNFSQTVSLPANYKGAIGIATTTDTKSARTSALVK